MYRQVPRTEILAALAHLRDLHRQIRPSNDRERYAFERRELVTKNLFSNLRRMGDHPTLSMLLELADVFSLTIEGAHRLFGYDLDAMREYDLRLNGGRTHIERPHERCCSGEVHCPLCMRHTHERECCKHRPQRARRLQELLLGKGLRPSLGTIGGVAT